MLIDEGCLAAIDGTRLFFQKVGNGPHTVIVPNGIYMLEDFARLADGRTLIFYDVRNRGRSDLVMDGDRIQGDIHQDVEDLEAVRQHFEGARVDLIGHSYIGLMVTLYAMKYPAHVNRVVQICPGQPNAATKYPAHLTNTDNAVAEAFSKIGQIQKEMQSADPVETCRKIWAVMQTFVVVDPANAGKFDLGRCDLPNERNFLRYWMQNILPSLQRLALNADDFAKAAMPVLILHGRMDRNAPYGSGREWAQLLPDARLVTLENSAHAPWIEEPELAFGAMESFLGGAWPETARKVDQTSAG
jgi:pimeloyl-ACP methyl ester carboxylesterase